MNFWEWTKYIGWKVDSIFDPDHQKRIDAASHADSLWQVTHPTNDVDTWINDTVNAGDVHFTGFVGVLDDVGRGVKGLFKSVWTTLNSLIKELPILLPLAMVLLVLYLIMPLIRKGEK